MVSPAEEEDGWESDVDPIEQEMKRYGLTKEDLDLLAKSRDGWRKAKGPARTKIGQETYLQILDLRPGLKDNPRKQAERDRKSLRDVSF